MRLSILVVMLVFIGGTAARAEYPALERALTAGLDEFSQTLADNSVLVSLRDFSRLEWPWRVPEALETEIVAQLGKNGIRAADDDVDERFAWLAESKQPFSHTDIARWRREPVYDALVIADLRRERNELVLRLAAHGREDAAPLKLVSLRLQAADVAIQENIPQLNQKVADFVRSHLGRAIGDGECWLAASEALKAVGAQRTGIYIFGRELGPGEALLPGDILQLEKVRFQAADGKRRATMNHHTAVIHEILHPDTIRILHQNFASAGRTISEYTLHLDEIRQGVVVAYRPTTGESSLPLRLAPYRRIAAKPVIDARGRIDLLKTIDPLRDAVCGIWQYDQGALTCHKERYAKLQIPVDVPESYVLSATVKRIFGVDTLAFVLVVDGRQVLLAMDGYGGEVAGLGLVNGKKQNNNETTTRMTVLPENKAVQIEIRVTPESVSLTADGEQIVQWQGDAAAFSMQEEWQVPRKDWLHLACYEAGFEISSLWLEARRSDDLRR
jgi:hypothetical protein